MHGKVPRHPATCLYFLKSAWLRHALIHLTLFVCVSAGGWKHHWKGISHTAHHVQSHIAYSNYIFIYFLLPERRNGEENA